MELNRATKAYGAYVNDEFVGALLAEIKGIGTALLSALKKEEHGKLIYLYTDNVCTYQFYEHRGFIRVGEKQVELNLKKKKVPLTC